MCILIFHASYFSSDFRICFSFQQYWSQFVNMSIINDIVFSLIQPYFSLCLIPCLYYSSFNFADAPEEAPTGSENLNILFHLSPSSLELHTILIFKKSGCTYLLWQEAERDAETCEREGEGYVSDSESEYDLHGEQPRPEDAGSSSSRGKCWTWSIGPENKLLRSSGSSSSSTSTSSSSSSLSRD